MEDEVDIFIDRGSAVMTAEMVRGPMPDRCLKHVDAAVGEGVVLAAIEAVSGTELEDLAGKMPQERDMHKIEI